jgi:hypothetical protein
VAGLAGGLRLRRGGGAALGGHDPRLGAQPGAAARASPLRELGALGRKQVWLTLGIAAIGFGGMFSVFSYVKPTLLQVAGMPLGWMPVVLSLFGVGMVGGNLIGSRLADKALMPTIGGLLIWSAAVQLLYVLTCHHPVAAALTVVLVGSAVAIGPALQIRLMDVAGDAQALAAALNHSAFNLANALGAWLGGLAIDAGLGYPSTGWVGTLLSLGGFGVFWWARQDARRGRRRHRAGGLRAPTALLHCPSLQVLLPAVHAAGVKREAGAWIALASCNAGAAPATVSESVARSAGMTVPVPPLCPAGHGKVIGSGPGVFAPGPS